MVELDEPFEDPNSNAVIVAMQNERTKEITIGGFNVKGVDLGRIKK